ncbi:MAG: hypothetical protein U0232_25215 [Thermomicrobiales bacterium]
MVHFVFHVVGAELTPAHGWRCSTRFFPTDALPAEACTTGTSSGSARCLEMLRDGSTHFDPADTHEGELPMFQRGAEC